ncbi:DnaJ domain-containing protein [Lepidopterella palustris CBS 459.81]|uniref:DnaJ domain-containing protein n=1 Tax=Lepidopterella palustris CBS 459.81 TaxID=1314670 RepID=A0A8E2E730_9PEZI|nr:DnaJ domain-containing protein [Lepidopterella palustris CBS 459.81]
MNTDEDEFLDEEPPTSIDPYKVLGLDKSASADEVKSAYRKAALKHHPDKAAEEDKEKAHHKFQEIAFAYAILSDERRRKRYDVTGRTEDSVHLEDDDDFDWMTFFREQWEDVVTPETISKFQSEYQGSDEEKNALLEAYEQFKGNMNKIYQVIMLSNPLNDEDRFRAILDAEIEAGNITAHKKYTEESEASRKRRISKARKEAEEADESLKELTAKKNSQARGSKSKGNSMDDLAALIQQRQKGRESNFFADLEAKYAPKKGKKRSAPDGEPPEEAFQKMGERIKKSKAVVSNGGTEPEVVGEPRRSKRSRS